MKILDLKEIRKWSHERRIQELKESVEWIEQGDGVNPDHPNVKKVLDACVVILLEVFRGVVEELGLEGFTSFDVYEHLLGLSKRGYAWDLVAARYLDTRMLVERFRIGDAGEKQRLRAQLVSRGMI